jgi:hypothetical protein
MHDRHLDAVREPHLDGRYETPLHAVHGHKGNGSTQAAQIKHQIGIGGREDTHTLLTR